MTTAKDLTLEELEKELKERKAAETAKNEKEKKDYITKRDKSVTRVVVQSARIGKLLSKFKTDTETVFEELKELCDKYGAIRTNSKGGFSLTTSDDRYKVVRKIDSKPVWNELCDKGIELITQSLIKNIKVKDKDMYDILMTYLKKNKKGDMNYPMVMKLFEHEDKFKDAEGKEGFRLLRENFKTSFTKYYYMFFVKNDNNEWENINLNIASI